MSIPKNKKTAFYFAVCYPGTHKSAVCILYFTQQAHSICARASAVKMPPLVSCLLNAVVSLADVLFLDYNDFIQIPKEIFATLDVNKSL